MGASRTEPPWCTFAVNPWCTLGENHWCTYGRKLTPLTFLAVLVPLVRARPALLTILVAALTALVLLRVIPDLAVLGAGITGSVAGAWASRWSSRGALNRASGKGGGR